MPTRKQAKPLTKAKQTRNRPWESVFDNPQKTISTLRGLGSLYDSLHKQNAQRLAAKVFSIRFCYELLEKPLDHQLRILNQQLALLPKEMAEQLRKYSEQWHPLFDNHFKSLNEVDYINIKRRNTLFDKANYALLHEYPQIKHILNGIFTRRFEMDDITYLNSHKSIIILLMKSVTHWAFARINTGKDYYELYQEAKNGNTQSLFELLRIDKIVFSEPWVQERYKAAVSTNDGWLIKQIAAALKKPVIERRQKRIKWLLAAYYLTYKANGNISSRQIADAINSAWPNEIDDPQSFFQYLTRANATPKQIAKLVVRHK